MRQSTEHRLHRRVAHRFNRWFTGRTALFRAYLCIVVLLLPVPVASLVAQDDTKANGNTSANDASVQTPTVPNSVELTLDAMDIEKKGLLTEEDVSDWLKGTGKYKDKGFRDYSSALKSNNPSDNEKEVIRIGARVRVHRMNLEVDRHRLPSLRKEILDLDIKLGTKGRPNTRQILLQELTNATNDLLDANFYVRLNAAVLLTQFNSDDGDYKKDIPATPFVPASVPLLKIDNDQKQPEPVKIIATRGLTRILMFGPDDQVPHALIAKTLKSEFERTGLHPWYQIRLIEGLGAIGDTARDDAKFVEILVKAIGAPNRHWLVRAEAAQAVGRLPLNGNINIDVVLFETVKLAKGMATEYNKKPDLFYWKNSFLKTYLTFKPKDSLDQADRNSIVDKMKSGQPAVVGAYRQVLPLAKHVIKSAPKPIPTAMIDTLKEWLDRNSPTNFSIAPGLDPITQQESESKPASEQPASAG